MSVIQSATFCRLLPSFDHQFFPIDRVMNIMVTILAQRDQIGRMIFVMVVNVRILIGVRLKFDVMSLC